MDIPKLNLASLKDKVTSSFAAASKQKSKDESKSQKTESKQHNKFDKKNKSKDFKNKENRKFNDDKRPDNRNDNKSKDFKKKESYSKKSNDFKKKESYSKKSNDFKTKESYSKKSNDFKKKESYSKKSNDFKMKESYSKPSSEQPESEMDALRRDALELGATEEDLKLIEDVQIDENQSEEEFADDNSKVDSKLTGDISKLLKDIGLSNSVIPVIEEDNIPELADSKAEETSDKEEEEVESEEEEEVEEEEENEAESESEEVEEKKPELKKETKQEQQKESNKDKLANLQSVVTDRLIVPAITEWYTIPLKLKNPEKLNPAQIEKLYEQAKSIIENENEVYYEEFNKSSSQKKFLSQILSNGTLSDKISALTLLIQEAPLHNIKALDNMFGMCEKKSRTAALQCINALTDLFVNGILPPNRKLKYFNKQPLSSSLTPQQLALLYFEDYLKKMYYRFIGSLEKLSHDSIVHVRAKVVGHLFDLLKAKPEQEANLLRLGVNKLGDIENKVSSKASYQILQLEQQHPAMKPIVVEQVVDFLFRTNNENSAIYYSVLALNQTILTRREEKLANKLVDAYFKLFEKQLIETDSLNVSKLKESEHQKDGKRKRNFKKGKKGGKSVKNDKTEEELSEEKNSKLFAAILTGLNRAYPFSNLPSDIFNSHLDTLYKITHSTNFNTSIQALLLIHNITVTQKGLTEHNKDRFYRTLYESLLDSRLLTSSKQGIYLNLLFKALKEDENKDRVLAFVKRIVQICLGWLNVGTISGMLYLLIELEKSVPELRNLFYNTPMDDILNAKEEVEEDDSENEGENEEKKQQVERAFYDPRKRDPKFANANKSSVWEINHFISHYHPTVALYAESFLEGPNSGNKVTKPDLGLFSLSHFLDRFVYKNFKKNASTRGTSIMQPLGGLQTGSLLVKATGTNDKEIPANTTDWISKKIGDIKPEDMFFYQYFSTKQDKIARSQYDKDIESKAQEYDDDEEEAEELDDDTVWNALVKSNPEVEGDEDELEDDFSDFDEADFNDLDDDEDEEEPNVPNLENIGEDDNEEEEDLDADGLIRLTTIEDLEGDDEDEIDEDGSDAEISEDEDIGDLLGEDDAELSDDEEVSSEEVDEQESEEETTSKKRKSSEKRDSKKSKKLKLSSLPRFASAEDYAEYLQSSDEDNF